MESLKLRALIRSKYAWPGGYPMYGITNDGAALCIDCMRKEYKQIAYARKHNLRDGWRIDAVDINYEDTDLACEHCNQSIESAYGEQYNEIRYHRIYRRLHKVHAARGYRQRRIRPYLG